MFDMRLGRVKTKMSNVIFHKGGASRLLGTKLVAHRFILGAVLGTSLLAACATTQNPTSLSLSSVSSSSDIVIRRSATAPNQKLTDTGSLAVDENNASPVNSVINVDNAPQQLSAGNLSNDFQNDVAARVIDTIIWQIQKNLWTKKIV